MRLGRLEKGFQSSRWRMMEEGELVDVEGEWGLLIGGGVVRVSGGD